MKRINSRPRFVVTDDGEGIANHAGSALLSELADFLGLTTAVLNSRSCASRGLEATCGSNAEGQPLLQWEPKKQPYGPPVARRVGTASGRPAGLPAGALVGGCPGLFAGPSGCGVAAGTGSAPG